MPRPKATEPMTNFTLALPVALRDTFAERAAQHGEIPTLVLRKLIRTWLHKHPAPVDVPAAPIAYDDI